MQRATEDDRLRTPARSAPFLAISPNDMRDHDADNREKSKRQAK